MRLIANRFVLAILALITGLAAAPVLATGPSADPERLEAVKRALEQARDKGAAIHQRAADQTRALARLKRRLIEIAATTRRLDDEIIAKDAALASLFAREAKAAKILAERRNALSRLLAALQHIARQPVRASTITGSANPLATLRGGVLLRHAVPRLDRDARMLAAELRVLKTLRRTIAREQLERDRTLVSLTVERRALARLINERRRMERRWRKASATAESNVARLANEAEGIGQLLARITQAQKDVGLRPDDLRAAPDQAAALVVARHAQRSLPHLPVAGKVIKNFGGKVQGATVRTRRAAEVVAPKAGRVVFAGPFRGYGRLLIIQHPGGYHMLFAGLRRLHASLGDEVLAGEPIGAMDSRLGRATDLYIELRHSGRPVNPLPWLAANSNKVSG